MKNTTEEHSIIIFTKFIAMIIKITVIIIIACSQYNSTYYTTAIVHPIGGHILLFALHPFLHHHHYHLRDKHLSLPRYQNP